MVLPVTRLSSSCWTLTMSGDEEAGYVAAITIFQKRFVLE
jgi:hypothetical protein